MNDSDPAGGDAGWLAQLPSTLQFRQYRAPGSHSYADYAANGSVVGAFRFVLERLMATPAVEP